jgi:hypothetical protein
MCVHACAPVRYHIVWCMCVCIYLYSFLCKELTLYAYLRTCMLVCVRVTLTPPKLERIKTHDVHIISRIHHVHWLRDQISLAHVNARQAHLPCMHAF